MTDLDVAVFMCMYPPCPASTLPIKQIVYNDCGADSVSSDIQLTVTSVKNINLETIAISPNPAIDYIQLHGLANKSSYSYTVSDTRGSIIQYGTFDNNRIPLRLSHGIYMLKIYDQNKVLAIKKLLVTQ